MSGLQRSTPLSPGKPLNRTEWKRKPPKVKKRPKPRSTKNDFPEAVKAFVRKRSGNMCEVRSKVCTGKASQFHHRKLREHGDHRAVNCLHACLECHGHIHTNVGVAYLMGWLVRSMYDPAEIEIKRS